MTAANKPVHVRVKATGFDARLSREEWDGYPRKERAKFSVLSEGDRPKQARKGEEPVEMGGAAPPVLVLTPPEEE